MLDTPIFRWSVAGVDGVETSPIETLRDSALRPWVKVGEGVGFERVVGPYSLGRTAGKEFDSNSNSLESVDVAS
jgi:hypothetical protein